MKNQQQVFIAALAAASSAVLVPVTFEGQTFMADANSFSKDNRKVLHGDYKGETVNSPAILTIGQNVVVWPEASEPRAESFTKASLGVLATQFLQSEGHQISPASGPA